MASEGSDSVYLVVVKMLTCGHAVIEIVHVQIMPFRHVLWSKQRCYRLFETLPTCRGTHRCSSSTSIGNPQGCRS